MKFDRYRAQVVQRLLPRDEVTRVEFCNQMLGNLNEDSGVVNNVLTRDEAHLQVSTLLLNKMFDTRHQYIPEKCTNGHCILQK